MIDFLIVYQVVPRELESVMLLRNELVRRGYSVETSGWILDKSEQKALKNQAKVMLVPSLYHNNELIDRFYLPFGKAEKIVHLRWEQYYRNEVMENPQDNLYLYPCESGREAYHLCWGQRSYENMREIGIAEDKLIKAGPLHMDILRDEFRSYFLSKSELLSKYGLDASNKTVLFISSFTNHHDRRAYFKDLNKSWSGKYKINERAVALEIESFFKSVEWFESFMQKHPNVNFIFRPHPADNVNTKELRVLEKRYPGFRVIRDYSVKQWILSCDRIVTWMSTSIMEAFFANKRCYIIRPVEYPYELDMCVYNNAKFITTKEEFFNILDTECEASIPSDFAYYYYDVRETPGYVRLSDELETIYKAGENFPWDEEMLKKADRERLKRLAESAGRSIRHAKNDIILRSKRFAKHLISAIKNPGKHRPKAGQNVGALNSSKPAKIIVADMEQEIIFKLKDKEFYYKND